MVQGLMSRRGGRRVVSAVVALAWASATALAMATVGALPAATPLSSLHTLAQQGKPPLDVPSVPVRIRVPAIGIDLPVVSSERNVPGNTRGYPLCDVAQYWSIYDLPGAPGTTWIYAHAQPGMFLPLFMAANATDGSTLLGKEVTLQLRDGRLLRYEISEVKQHALNRRIASAPRPSAHRLVLQTSEGPPGTVPKLQVAARLTSVEWTDDRAPRPQPRACWQPRTTTADNRNGGRAGDRGVAAAAASTASPTDDAGTAALAETASLAVGGGAVLLGATILAVYLVRRPPSERRPRP